MRPLYFIGLLIYSAVSIVVTAIVSVAIWAKANQVDVIKFVFSLIVTGAIIYFFPNAFDQWFSIGAYAP